MAATTLRRLLIVEDEQDVRDFLKRAFSRIATQATIETAENGADALRQIQAGSFDLVVSDNRMPVMTGIEMIQAARAQGLSVPILIFSADVTVERLALAAGATGFLHKPIPLETIIRITQRWLS